MGCILSNCLKRCSDVWPNCFKRCRKCVNNMGSCCFQRCRYPTHPVFGVSLVDAQRSYKLPRIPQIVVECIEFIESCNYLEAKGIYRISGRKTKIDDLKRIVMWNPPITKWSRDLVYCVRLSIHFSVQIHVYSSYDHIQNQDIHTVTGVLKLYFSELEPGLIPCDNVATLIDRKTDETRRSINVKFLSFVILWLDLDSEESLEKIRSYLEGLRPIEHYETLKYLMKHLHKYIYIYGFCVEMK